MPMVIWLMVSFFENMPHELEDAAMIDGCSRWQSFRLIVLPVSIFAFFVRKSIVQGLTMGALKDRWPRCLASRRSR